MQSKHLGLTVKDLEWFRGKVENLGNGATLPVPLHHVLMDTAQYNDMRGMGLDVDAQFSYMVARQPHEARGLLGKPYFRDLLRRVCDGEKGLRLSDTTKSFVSQFVRCPALQAQQIAGGASSSHANENNDDSDKDGVRDSDDENECDDFDCAQRADDDDDDE